MLDALWSATTHIKALRCRRTCTFNPIHVIRGDSIHTLREIGRLNKNNKKKPLVNEFFIYSTLLFFLSLIQSVHVLLKLKKPWSGSKSPKKKRKGGKRIYKEIRIVKNHQLNPAWKTITVYVVISCKGCKFGGRGGWGMTGAAAGKPGKPGVRWTQCVCTEQIETTMQTLTFFGGVALSRNGHKNDQTWQWLCKGGGGALFSPTSPACSIFGPFFSFF